MAAYSPIYDSREERVALQMAPDAAFKACVAAMKKIGAVTRAKPQPFGRVVGHTRLKGLTYAELTVVIQPGDQATSAVVTVSASAPEGTAGPITAVTGVWSARDYAAQGVQRFFDALQA